MKAFKRKLAVLLAFVMVFTSIPLQVMGYGQEYAYPPSQQQISQLSGGSELVLRGDLTGGGSYVFQAGLPGGTWAWGHTFTIEAVVKGQGQIALEAVDQYGGQPHPNPAEPITIDADDWQTVSTDFWNPGNGGNNITGISILDVGAGVVYIQSVRVFRTGYWNDMNMIYRPDFTVGALTFPSQGRWGGWGRYHQGWFTSNATVWSIVDLNDNDNDNDNDDPIDGELVLRGDLTGGGSYVFQAGLPGGTWAHGQWFTIEAVVKGQGQIAFQGVDHWGGQPQPQYPDPIVIDTNDWQTVSANFWCPGNQNQPPGISILDAGAGVVYIQSVRVFRYDYWNDMNLIYRSEFEELTFPSDGRWGEGRQYLGWLTNNATVWSIATIGDTGNDNDNDNDDTPVPTNLARANLDGGWSQMSKNHDNLGTNNSDAGFVMLQYGQRYELEIQYRSTGIFALYMSSSRYWNDGIGAHLDFTNYPHLVEDAFDPGFGWMGYVISPPISNGEWYTRQYGFTADFTDLYGRTALYFHIYDLLGGSGIAYINYVGLRVLDDNGNPTGPNLIINGDFSRGTDHWVSDNGSHNLGTWNILANQPAPRVPVWATIFDDNGNDNDNDNDNDPGIDGWHYLNATFPDRGPVPALPPATNRDPNHPSYGRTNYQNIGIYLWDRNPTAVLAFEEWIGRDVLIAEDFQPFYGSFAHMVSNQRAQFWRNWVADNPARRLAIALPVFPADRSNWPGSWDGERGASQRALDQFRAAAAGDFNDYYRQFAEMLIHYGLGNSIIRFGHEFDGNWYAWSISVGPGSNGRYTPGERAYLYAEAFRQMARTMREVDGANFYFCWNPNAGFVGPDVLRAAWPGAEYVDYISFDQYDHYRPQYYNNPTYIHGTHAERRPAQEAAWANLYYGAGRAGLQWFAEFSREVDVPLTIGEWGLWYIPGSPGTSGGDNPYFVRRMFNYINDNNVAWHVYFMFGDVCHSLWNLHTYPAASREFLYLWHPDGAPGNYPWEMNDRANQWNFARPVGPAVWPGDIAPPAANTGRYVIHAQDAMFFGQDWPIFGRALADPWSLSGSLGVTWRDATNAIRFTVPHDADGFALVYQSWTQNLNYHLHGRPNDRRVSLYINNTLVDNDVVLEAGGRAWRDSYGYIVFDYAVEEGDTIMFRVSSANAAAMNHIWGYVKYDYLLLFVDDAYSNVPDEFPIEWPTFDYIPNVDNWDEQDPFIPGDVHRPDPTGDYTPPARATGANSDWRVLQIVGPYEYNVRIPDVHNYPAGNFIVSFWVRSPIIDGGTTTFRNTFQTSWPWQHLQGAVYTIPNDGEWHHFSRTVSFQQTPGPNAVPRTYSVAFGMVDNAAGYNSPRTEGIINVDRITLVSASDPSIVLFYSNIDRVGAPPSATVPQGVLMPSGWYGGEIINWRDANNIYVYNQDWAMRALPGAADSSLTDAIALEEDYEYTFAIFASGNPGDTFDVMISGDTQNISKRVIVTADWYEHEFTFTPTTSGNFTLTLGNFNLTAPLFLDCLLLYTPGTNNLIPNMDFELGNVAWDLGSGVQIINFSEPDLGADAIFDDFSEGLNYYTSATGGVEVINSAGMEINLLPDPTFANTPSNCPNWFGYWGSNRANWDVVDIGGGNYAVRAVMGQYPEWGEWMTAVDVVAGRTYRMGLRVSGTGTMGSYIMQTAPGVWPNEELPDSHITVNPTGATQIFEITFVSTHTGTVGFTMQDNGGSGTIYIEEIWLYELPEGNSFAQRVSGNLAGEAYLLYALGTEYSIRHVSVDAFVHGDIDPATAFNFEVSADGTTFVPVEMTVDTVIALAGNTIVFENHSIPANMRYLRISFADVADVNHIQVDAVYVNARTSPVVATPGIRNEVFEHDSFVDVVLTTVRPGATISFSLNGGPAQVYSAPIRLTGTDTLVTWSTEFPLHTSFVSTYYFFNTDSVRIDRLGQVISAAGNFPTWVDPETPDEGLHYYWDSDAEWLAQFSRPVEWDAWGGLAGSGTDFGFAATGFFRVENYTWPDGRVQSFMLNPLGNIYFNNAPNIVNDFETFTIVGGRHEIYAWLPTGDPNFTAAWRAGGNTFSFYAANWIRRGGNFNQTEFRNVHGQRLVDLGFTGEGGWSMGNIAPYLPQFEWLNMPSIVIPGSHLWDIFNPNFESQMNSNFAVHAGRANDASIVGWFMGNERYWDHLRVRITNADGAASGTRARLVEMLQDIYPAIEDFNYAWDLSAANWNALLSGAIPLNTNQASLDMDAFYHIFFSELYSMTRRAMDTHLPNHMLLGCRWHGRVIANSSLANIIVAAAGPYLGAMSWNYYAWDVNLDLVAHLYELGGQTPFIITEFHYGDLSTGLTFGVRVAENEYEKGSMYRNYVERLAYSGHVVGVNWFTWIDQPATGRYFEGLYGEAGALGFFNVMDRPYRYLLEHVTTTNFQIYDVILRNVEPFRHEFREGQIDRDGDQHLQIPVIEGGHDIHDLSQPWEGAARAHLGPMNFTEGVLTQDIAADFYLAWYGDYLYLRAEILDPSPMMNTAALYRADRPAEPNAGLTWVWASDAIELFIGPDNVEQGGGMHRTDTQLLFGAHRNDADPANHHTIHSWYNRGNLAGPPHSGAGPLISGYVTPLEVGARLWDCGGGYTLAARVPLGLIGGRYLEMGDIFRFDMGISAAVAPSGGRSHQMMWNGTNFNSSSRERWGTIELVDVVRHTVYFYDDDEQVAYVIVEDGETVTPPADPVRDGYDFDGWFTEDDVLWDFDTPIYENITLFARWTQISGCGDCDNACCIECDFHYENCEVEDCPCPHCEYLAWRAALAAAEEAHQAYLDWLAEIAEAEAAHQAYLAWLAAIAEAEAAHQAWLDWLEEIRLAEIAYQEWRDWLCATGQCGGCDRCD